MDFTTSATYGRYEADYIRDHLVRQLRFYDATFNSRVFPAVADPAGEARRAAEELWGSLMSRPGEGDPGADAERAGDREQDVYQSVQAMHQIILNLFTAGLFHLFEQQAATLYCEWTGKNEGGLGALTSWLLKTLKVDVKSCPHWQRVDELRLVANVVKHAEGHSAQDLRAVNPLLFDHALLRQPEYSGIPKTQMPVREPLAGDDLFLIKEDYDAYVGVLVHFWHWLADAIAPLEWASTDIR
jgi:hypothetical protein